QRGIDDAINLYGAKIITWMDCDLSMPPEDVPQLVTAIRAKKADMAVGSRWIPGRAVGRSRRGWCSTKQGPGCIVWLWFAHLAECG
ncbi:MAG: glycosyltransferase, partial [Microcystis panniformis]